MKRSLKYLLIAIMYMVIIVLESDTYAASANISATKTTAYVGDSITVNVNINAAAWNLNVSGDGINGGNITGFNMEGTNQNTSRNYNLNTSSVGVYVISLTGDISDGNTDVTSDISKSVTITVKEKPVLAVPTPEPTITTPSPNNANINEVKQYNSETKSITNAKANRNPTTVSNNAYLSEFRIDQPGITPDFNKSVYNYSITVGEDVDNLNISAVPEDNKAIVQISGNTNLEEGENIINIKVTAEDKKTTNTYTLLVTKSNNPEKTNAYLQNILVEGITIMPEFSQEIFEYSLGNTNLNSLKILAFPVYENAKVDIIGNDNLIIGENNIRIIVTSENGKMQNTYNLKVIRDYKEQNSLKDVKKNDKFLSIWKALKENAAILLLYAFVWVEFLQVVYLYERLQKAENVDLINKEKVQEEAYIDRVKRIIKRIKIWKK